MCTIHFHSEMWRICCTNVASRSATRWFDFGEQVWPVVCRGDPKKTGSAPSRSFELAMALGRSVRKNQRRNPLSLAGCGSRRRSVGKLRCEAPRSKGSIEIPKKNNETIWFTICHHVTDLLRSYGAAMKVISNVDKQKKPAAG